MRNRLPPPTRYKQERIVGSIEIDEETSRTVIRPQFIAARDEPATWLPVPDGQSSIYPPRGLVAVPAHLAKNLPDGLLNVVLRQMPFRKDETGIKDQWEAQHAFPLEQLIDLRPYAENADGKRQLMSLQGVELGASPFESALLQVDENLYIGPFSLVAAANQKSHFRIADKDLYESIPVLKGNAHAAEIEWDGKEIVVSGPGAQLSASEYWDWRPDADFIDDVIDKLRASLSRSTSDESLVEIERSLAAATGTALSRAQAKRLGDMVAQRQLSDAQTREFVGHIRGTAIGADIINELLQIDVQAAKARMQRELDDDFLRRRLELEQELGSMQNLLGEAKQARERVLRDLDTALAQRKSEVESLERRADALEQAFSQSMHDLIERIGRTNAALDSQADVTATLRREIEDSILGQLEDLIDDAVRHAPSMIAVSGRPELGTFIGAASYPPFTPSSQSIAPIDSPKLLSSGIVEALRKHGFGQQSTEGILAAWAERLVPMVSGSRSLEFLEALATQISNGQILITHVHPDLLVGTDLFGRFDAQTGRFVASASRLADLIIHAGDFHYPVIVVLEGINRVPIESSLLPLLESYAAPERRPIRLASPSSVRPEDPFASFAEFTWPPNLLLAATFVEGPSTFAIPKIWWRFGTFLDVRQRLRDAAIQSPSTQSIEFSGWARVTTDLQQRKVKSIGETLDAELEDVRALPDFLQTTARYLGRSMELFADEDPVTPVVAQLILPALIQINHLDSAEKFNKTHAEYIEEPKLLDRIRESLQA